MAHLDTARFQFIADALNGSGVFRPSVNYDSNGVPYSVSRTALVRYPRESEVKFARRNDVAWYENHLLSSCRRFVGYLAKKPPLRDIGLPLLQSFADDCDWRGNSLDVFMQAFMVEAKARGSMLLLVDMPAFEVATLAEQQEKRFFPYLVPIRPETLVSYEMNDQGLVDRVEWNIHHDGAMAIKGFDDVSWWIRVGDREIEHGEHNLGMCPVIAFSESYEFPSFGDFAQIADISKRLFNVRSELDEILRAQTFSILVAGYPHDQPGARESLENAVIQIGTSNALVTPGTLAEFIAPPEGPAAIYLETIAKLEEAIKRVALVVEAPDHQRAESGLAMTIRFQALNSALTSFARKMEDFERRIWAVVCAWINLSGESVTVEWAKDYALADLKTELEVLGAMQLSGFPVEAIQQQQKQVAALAFSTAEPATQQAVIDAIDAGSHERVPVAPVQAGDLPQG